MIYRVPPNAMTVFFSIAAEYTLAADFHAPRTDLHTFDSLFIVSSFFCSPTKIIS